MDIPSYILGRIKGSGGAGVSYIVVEELPTTGEEGKIYLVPKSTSKTDNVYNEYMYINENWELIGDTQADLTNYAQKNEVLTKTNTTAFTPTQDYHPAPKKYVDDNAGAGIYNIRDGLDLTKDPKPGLYLDDYNNSSYSLKGINGQTTLIYPQFGRVWIKKQYSKADVDDVIMLFYDSSLNWTTIKKANNERGYTVQNNPGDAVNKNYIPKAVYSVIGINDYSPYSTYEVGNYVNYNNKIYRCKIAVTTWQSFDNTKWEEKTFIQYMNDVLIGTALQGNY